MAVYRDGDFEASATGLEAVQALSDVIRERLREREKTISIPIWWVIFAVLH